MASLYCPGVAQFFMGVGANFAPLYFGTCEDEPTIELVPSYTPVRNQLAGSVKPLDRQFQGEDAFVFATFSRYNEPVLAAVQATPYRNRARGYQPFGSRGAFMQMEGLSFPLWLTFPFVTKAEMQKAGMPAGYRFPVAMREGPDRMPVGTTYRTVTLAFYCEGLFTTANGGEFLLYDHNTRGLPPID